MEDLITVRKLILALQKYPMTAKVMMVNDSSARESIITGIQYDAENDIVVLMEE
jgi:hypothetical protein